ncbi:MAG: SAM-dependent methyltransferase [Actinomycetota bacterium]
MTSRPWQDAWHDALYGAEGFYRSNAAAGHFRTSVHAGPLLAGALARLAASCGLRRVVDVGSGRGELLGSLADADPRLALLGVDVVARPPGLPSSADWLVAPGGADLPPDLDARDALVVAHEWLDDVPCPVLQLDDDGALRVVSVAADGTEHLGDRAGPDEQAWAARWWPTTRAGDRVEVGLPRERAWADLVARAGGSVLVAVDYAHDRLARPSAGTLVGYRDGRAVPPVPDGTCDITAHVALDTLSGAGVRTTQRAALQALGVDATRPSIGLATTDPMAYLAALARAGEAAELLDPDGLGGFGWLVVSRGPTLPTALRRLDSGAGTSPG